MGAAKQSRQKGLSFQELFHKADEELYRIKKEKKKSMDEGVEKV